MPKSLYNNIKINVGYIKKITFAIITMVKKYFFLRVELKYFLTIEHFLCVQINFPK